MRWTPVLLLSAVTMAACDYDDGRTATERGRLAGAGTGTGAPGMGRVEDGPGRRGDRGDVAGLGPDGRPMEGRDGRPDGRPGMEGRRDMDGRGPMLRVDPGDMGSAPVNELVAVVMGVGKEKDITGQVTFTTSGNAVQVNADVKGLPAGMHGYHVHLYGDCTAVEADSPGPHLNFSGASMKTSAGMTPPGTVAGNPSGTTGTTGPTAAPAGTPSTTAPSTATGVASVIHGNLGDLDVAQGGRAQHQAPLGGDVHLTELLGRAVVIHEKGNDAMKAPDGGAGKPIACGVIGVANPSRTAVGAAEKAEP